MSRFKFKILFDKIKLLDYDSSGNRETVNFTERRLILNVKYLVNGLVLVTYMTSSPLHPSLPASFIHIT